MTRNELYTILQRCGWETTPIHTLDKIWGRAFDGETVKITERDTKRDTERDTKRDTETAEEKVAWLNDRLKSLASAYGSVIRSRYRVDVQSASGRWDNVEIRDDEAIARQDESEWRSRVNENRGQWKDVRIVEETTTAKVLPFNPIQPNL